jgi:deazaflavin-dependent oxidoreductase (nitroreductase family)
MIIACKAAPARCSVAAIVASRSPSAVNTSIDSLSMHRSRSARSRPQGGKPSYAEDRRIIRAFAIVRHRGRRTGRAYAAPVLAFGSEDGLVVGVLYGTTSDWVRNVLAGDGADVKWHGQSRAYDQPRLISSEEGLPTVPTVIRGPFRLLGVRNFVRLTASSLEDAPN